MIKRQLLFAGVVAAALPTAALAESLRCQNGIASEGDSRIALVYKCGQPTPARQLLRPGLLQRLVLHRARSDREPVRSVRLHRGVAVRTRPRRVRGRHPHARRQGAVHHLRPAAAVAIGKSPMHEGSCHCGAVRLTLPVHARGGDRLQLLALPPDRWTVGLLRVRLGEDRGRSGRCSSATSRATGRFGRCTAEPVAASRTGSRSTRLRAPSTA